MVTYTEDVTVAPASEHVRAGLEGLPAAMAMGFRMYGSAGSRLREIERLRAKPDSELAGMGLKREEIARHVFRDVLSR